MRHLSQQEWNEIVRGFVAFVWLVAAFSFVYAYRNETITVFRPMRIYAATVCFVWAAFMFYTAIGLAGVVVMPGWVTSGLISGTLMVPTAGYLAASAWVTHKVVKSWE